MAGITPGTAVLWLGNDTFAELADGVDVVAMDMGGNILLRVEHTAMTGVAFDGTNLWFSVPVRDPDHVKPTVCEITKRNTDGSAIPGTSFTTRAFSETTGDLAYDSTRNLLWRVDALDNNGHHATLVQIDPAAAEPILNSFELAPDPDDSSLRQGYGLTYDKARDLLYVSYGDPNDAPEFFTKGVVFAVDPKTLDPNTVTERSELLFRTASKSGTADAFSSAGGLGYDATTDTLWVGAQPPFLRHHTRDGQLLAVVTHGQKYVDGLEFVGGI
jgi:hypothetical protein